MFKQIKNLINLFSKKDKFPPQHTAKPFVSTVPTLSPQQIAINTQTNANTQTIYQEEISCATNSPIFESSNQEPLVITFEERKKTCIPSKSGLYVAEILLLYYCNKYDYPNPKFGYQDFWWSEYGIDDVELKLKDLNNRGYIKLETVKNAINQLSIKTLRNILTNHGLETVGKKQELQDIVAEVTTDEELLENGVCPKYILTQRGIQEIHENKYVPYMHIYSTTIEGVDNEFNVWTVNKELGNKDKLFWDKYILEKFINSSSDNDDSYLNPKNYAKKHSISDAKIIKLQDKQFKKINKAEEKYFRNNNLNEHIAFWENLWNTEGLIVRGVSWCFKLADLYIEAKEYDKALDFVKKINKLEPSCLNNTEYYLETISKLIAKQKKPNL